MTMIRVNVAELIGSFADNDCLRRIAIKLEDDGDVAQALAIFRALKAHIDLHPGDRKSVVWLLPDVEGRIARLTSPAVSPVVAPSPGAPSGASSPCAGHRCPSNTECMRDRRMEATVVRWLLKATFLEHAARYLSATIGPLVADVQSLLKGVGPVVQDAVKAFVIALGHIFSAK